MFIPNQSKDSSQLNFLSTRSDVAELGPAQTQLVFFTSETKKRAPTRSWAQGPHMVKFIPE